MTRFFRIVNSSLAVCWLVLSASLWAQSNPPTTSSTSASLSDQETRGEGLFLQRCGLCHLPKRPSNKAVASASPVGPLLNGLFKDAKPDKESQVRQIILKGTPHTSDTGFHCLGFQYSLGSQEVDDLIAYLKTL